MNGKEAAPLYKYLKSQKGGFLGDGIKWNFTKFLVNKDGKVVERYAPTTSPLKIRGWFTHITVQLRIFDKLNESTIFNFILVVSSAE